MERERNKSGIGDMPIEVGIWDISLCGHLSWRAELGATLSQNPHCTSHQQCDLRQATQSVRDKQHFKGFLGTTKLCKAPGIENAQ